VNVVNALLRVIRSFGFGALIGAGIMGYVHCKCKSYFDSQVTLRDAIAVGALLGAGFHQLIKKIVRILFLPTSAEQTLHLTIMDINTSCDKGYISTNEADSLARRAHEEYRKTL
jgi:hypothetical protein